jgi:hypothetical protein
MSWAPYLLNSFLEDCKDTQDWGSKFHYSWLLILIGLIGWKEPVYNKYLERPGNVAQHATYHYAAAQTRRERRQI